MAYYSRLAKPEEGLGGLGLTPLNKYHAALTMHRYTLIEQSNILIERSS